jgi:hypothetical protein
LPDLERWPEQFARTANGTYLFRGAEVTIQGQVQEKLGELFLTGNSERPEVALAPLQASARIQWDHKRGVRKPFEGNEEVAYANLVAKKRNATAMSKVTVTGPLSQTDAGFVLQVRVFKAPEAES